MTLPTSYQRLKDMLAERAAGIRRPLPEEPSPVPPQVLPPELEALLPGLDEVPWGELHHAYGPACDTPNLLRALLSDRAELRRQADMELSASICHQLSLYPATARAVPFLARLLQSPRVADRHAIIRLLHAIGVGTECPCGTRGEAWQAGAGSVLRKERAWATAAHAAVRAEGKTYLALLDDPEEDVRAAIGILLMLLPGAEIVAAAVWDRLPHEEAARPRASMMMTLLHVSQRSGFETAGLDLETVRTQLRSWLTDRAQPALVRASSAIAMVGLGTIDDRVLARAVFAETVLEAMPAFEEMGLFAADWHNEILEWMCHAFGNDPAAAEWLREILVHPAADVRFSALHAALWWCSEWRGTTDLVAESIALRVGDEDPLVRRTASHRVPALGRIAPSLTLPVLGQLQRHEQPEVRELAGKTIVELEKCLAGRALLAGFPQPVVLDCPAGVYVQQLSASGFANQNARRRAAAALLQMGEAARVALPEIRTALLLSEFENAFPLACLIWALERDESLLPYFEEALNRRRECVPALERLAEMGAAAAALLPKVQRLATARERPLRHQCPPGDVIYFDEEMQDAARRALARIEA